jgi:hypothetical protein
MVNMNYLIGGLASGGGQALQQTGLMKREEIRQMIAEARADSRAAEGERRADERSLRSDQSASERQASEFAQRDKENELKRQGYDKVFDAVDPKDGKSHTYAMNDKGDKRDLGVTPPKEFSPGNGYGEPLVPVRDPENPNGPPIYLPRSQAVGLSPPPSKDEATAISDQQFDAQTEAEQKATAEAESKAGLWSTDSSDFSADGGSREAFIKRRTQELLKDPNSTDSKASKPKGGEAKDAPVAGGEDTPKKLPKGGTPQADSQVKTDLPSPPASLAGRALQWNPTKKQYRDKATGEIFDLQGKPVNP